MGVLCFLSGAARRILNFLFPQRCLLCGSFLGGEAVPVCDACAAKLAVPEGPRCRVCSQVLISEKDLCMDCRAAAPAAGDGKGSGGAFQFESNYSLFPYQDPLAMEMVVSYKGRKRRSLAAFFAGKIVGAYRREWQGLPIVPVPCRRASVKKRGYDQVALLCRAIRRRNGARILPLLRLKGKTLEQKTLNREQRAKNLCGAIAAARNFRKYAKGGVPEAVLLLDDVFTTGATANACAAALKSMGVKTVYVCTLARD
ncbi:MAG: double zinc ribbon domain-containing protein [Spirochaetia bacterium]|jgi:ComF family protein|nr:double zinc ribbon domain-containing protein [Spirochaetia bacterium]